MSKRTFTESTKKNEKVLNYEEVENRLKILGNENFGQHCNPETGFFVYPKERPIVITVIGGTGSGKTTFIKNTFLTTIRGFSEGEISVLFLQHSKPSEIQEKLSTLNLIVSDLEVNTYENWVSTIQRFVDSKRLDAPKLVILDDFTNELNKTKTAEVLRHLLNTYHNHKNTSYMIISHTATAENASSKTLSILKKESNFTIFSLSSGGKMLLDRFIAQFPATLKDTIKKKVDEFTYRLDQTDTSHIMINLSNGAVFDDNLRMITI